jgi:hypothetical protein
MYTNHQPGDRQVSIAGQALSEALERPEEWECRECVAEHTPSGIEVWTGNGASSFEFYKSGECLGFFERYRLYSKFMEMKNRQIAMKLKTKITITDKEVGK